LIGTGHTSWLDVWTVVMATASMDGPLGRALRGHSWTETTYLLAAIVDLLAVANWQRAGRKSAPKPRPVPRPGDKQREQRYGADPIRVADFDTWWSAPPNRT
jgi:hypothetical protein